MKLCPILFNARCGHFSLELIEVKIYIVRLPLKTLDEIEGCLQCFVIVNSVDVLEGLHGGDCGDSGATSVVSPDFVTLAFLSYQALDDLYRTVLLGIFVYDSGPV